jgi:hypothetical protein
VLLLSYEPGTGPAPGSPELDAELDEWALVTGETAEAGVLLSKTLSCRRTRP